MLIVLQILRLELVGFVIQPLLEDELLTLPLRIDFCSLLIMELPIFIVIKASYLDSSLTCILRWSAYFFSSSAGCWTVLWISLSSLIFISHRSKWPSSCRICRLSCWWFLRLLNGSVYALLFAGQDLLLQGRMREALSEEVRFPHTALSEYSGWRCQPAPPWS